MAIHTATESVGPGRSGDGRTRDATVGPNGIAPHKLTTAQRLDEVAKILALGLTRLKARQSSALPADFGESSLDCAGEQSGPANVLTDGGTSG